MLNRFPIPENFKAKWSTQCSVQNSFILPRLKLKRINPLTSAGSVLVVSGYKFRFRFEILPRQGSKFTIYMSGFTSYLGRAQSPRLTHSAGEQLCYPQLAWDVNGLKCTVYTDWARLNQVMGSLLSLLRSLLFMRAVTIISWQYTTLLWCWHPH